jgi:hypothetical protein
MKMAAKQTRITMRGGCHDCHGIKAKWTARNAVGVAAKHAQATGHETWVKVEVFVLYKKPIERKQSR